jgi:hypothetical protein
MNTNYFKNIFLNQFNQLRAVYEFADDKCMLEIIVPIYEEWKTPLETFFSKRIHRISS